MTKDFNTAKSRRRWRTLGDLTVCSQLAWHGSLAAKYHKDSRSSSPQSVKLLHLLPSIRLARDPAAAFPLLCRGETHVAACIAMLCVCLQVLNVVATHGKAGHPATPSQRLGATASRRVHAAAPGLRLFSLAVKLRAHPSSDSHAPRASCGGRRRRTRYGARRVPAASVWREEIKPSPRPRDTSFSLHGFLALAQSCHSCGIAPAPCRARVNEQSC